MTRLRAIVAGALLGVGGSAVLAAVPPLPTSSGWEADSLDHLFVQLGNARSETEAEAIEARIWELWSRSGRPEVDSLLRAGILATSVERYDEALRLFDIVIDRAPEFAEGWNKRATVHYLRGDLEEAQRDIDRTLELERRHFGALAGLGLIFLSIGDDRAALGTFERVLEINPASSATRRQIALLRSRMGYRST